MRVNCLCCECYFKFYGYVWFKIQLVGKNDKEECILDYCVINCFLDLEDEVRVWGKKGWWVGLQRELMMDIEGGSNFFQWGRVRIRESLVLKVEGVIVVVFDGVWWSGWVCRVSVKVIGDV